MGAVRDDLPIVTNFQGVSIGLLLGCRFAAAFLLQALTRVRNVSTKSPGMARNHRQARGRYAWRGGEWLGSVAKRQTLECKRRQKA